ncbi:hypothetical protein H9X85_04125 [Anaerotignum lactatifermentans]|uniref:Uncharacterized protein n=1 Tax=Anaerotignum lactatifermentans TaxID=160404 RepID=A0ABS2G731_9FIRM|nr:hypothetical protein [Anaerotignum lactatifermentans]MBM6828986.1 hypothetical protein [Anaerotignum lactatifermentans]MBM6876840.1 hypothetical protein [Anaerotignum lactatifermentans]MBM6950399.1 hypothetical protein [Anaerotignum lactatifermentans]
MDQRVKALFASAEAGRAQAERLAAHYCGAGWQVTLYPEALLEESRKRAEEEQMTHLLYFHDEERITLVSFADEMGGYSVDIQVSDLILPKK